MAIALYITLTPADSMGSPGWRFQIDRTNQVGFFPDTLQDAATSALCMALGDGRGAVVLTVPRSGRWPWQSRRFVVQYFWEVGQLRTVNVRLVRERFAAAERWRRRWERWRFSMGRVGGRQTDTNGV